MSYTQLENIATSIRRSIVQMVHDASSGHPGGSLSAVEIVTYLYFKEMNINTPDDENRDRFILSKGHAAPVLYSTLAEKGFIDKESLKTLRRINSKMQGHPDMRKVSGVEVSTGSLGQGLSIGNGMAMGFKMDKKPNRVFVLLGDGEIQEGMVWEAAMFAGHNKLNNVTAILDHNGLQIDGKNEDVVTVEPLDKKFEAFGWHVIKVDGHDFVAIENAFEERKKITDKPVMIIAQTVKGKGVSFMENNPGWHGKAPSDEELQIALNELGGTK
ncbi:transketolase [Sedimentibacter sp. zth1]|uniref:transketolase n=1 Tax=Sedimentibacter sp. zth1 TaxID=2816908 RepID=UPI001A92695C|nr:transketolase [Sedimentibacter sp. zth1]QSX06130.1 transketolase [Sedimentibacter sp. zth1]